MTRHETVSTLPSDYNMKVGPVLFNMNASLNNEYVDNIGLTSNGTKSDFIVTPEVGVTAQWPVTATNTLKFGTSLGYSKYLIHPEYDTGHLLIAPDSVLGFDIYVGDFKINLHDQFSYQQDPAQVGSVSNVVTFDRFENIAGVGVVWDLNKLVLGFNYDHINFWSYNLQSVNGGDYNNPGNLSYVSDQVSASAAYSLTSTVIFGLEGAASRRNYERNDIEDNQLSAGPFIRVQLTPNMKLSASGGYQTTTTTSGTLGPATTSAPNVISPVYGIGTTNSYYANLTLDHRWSGYYTDRLSGGHETQLDVFSQQNDVTYLTYTSSWKVNKFLNIATTLNFQDVDSPTSNFITGSSYDLFSAGVQANFPITRRISGALLYQFYDKFNTDANQDYEQNRVGFILNYHF